MSIETAIKDAAAMLGVYAPPAPISSTGDASAEKLLAIAHQAGDDIARRADWAAMVTSTTGTALPMTLPADFLRLVPGGAVNLISASPAPVRGPLSSDQIGAIGRLGTTTALFYALERGLLLGSRALSVGESVSVSYVSKNWMVSSSGSAKRERAAANDDATLFPERLLTKAIIWRWRRENGQQYQDQLAEWEADLALEVRQNRGVTT